ncbi:MAG: aspartate/tyrosine/aromatic aminotransferase [Candidatus Sumerlaeota bacterium]|nr:aspartate/tyrosine/aromatic aminotransferase [Candidatus Sumerlaeota bacterium]
MFHELSMAPPDAILGLTEAFKKDPRPGKINLGAGVYQNDQGQTRVFSSVKKAEAALLKEETTKNYLPIHGSEGYAAAVQELLFGEGREAVASGRIATAHAPGGTAALRVAADFLKKVGQRERIWVSDPTWANHPQVFAAAGLQVSTYPYYDAATKGLDFGRMLQAIQEIPAGDVILLHGCCHNPTGVDPALDQWKRIAEAVWARGVFPLIDFAYQGLGDGLEEDAAGVRLFAAPGREALIANSFSKNFGLYRERVGGLTVLGATSEDAQKAFSHVKTTIRANYSNPPSHGGAIVETILKDTQLKAEWQGEVTAIRDRIRQMRRLFVETLKAKGAKGDFSFIARQKGMFSFSGLGKEQVDALRERHAIYIVGGGRINVAGMTRANMEPLCQAIAGVMGKS